MLSLQTDWEAQLAVSSALQNPLTVSVEPAGREMSYPHVPLKPICSQKILGKLQCNFDGGNVREGVLESKRKASAPSTSCPFLKGFLVGNIFKSNSHC